MAKWQTCGVNRSNPESARKHRSRPRAETRKETRGSVRARVRCAGLVPENAGSLPKD